MKGAEVVATGSMGMRRISTPSFGTRPDADVAVDASRVGRGEVAVSDETVDSRPVPVADDDHDPVELVARRLARAGFVVTATDGAEALEVARSVLPDLVVRDVMMPHLTGVEVMRELRADPAAVSIPNILQSASLPPHPASDAAFAGADVYIKKPFGPTELPDRVRDVLQRTAAK